MEKTSGLSLQAATEIATKLQLASSLMNDTGRIVNASCTKEFADALKRNIGMAMSFVGGDVLEQMIYSQYPHLRPYSKD